MIVSLADLKQHLRVEETVTDDDQVIEALGLAAERQVCDWIGRPVYPRSADMPAKGSPDYNPAQIRADDGIEVAIKILAARLFDPDRDGGDEGYGQDAVPPVSVRALLAGYRVFHGENDDPRS